MYSCYFLASAFRLNIISVLFIVISVEKMILLKIKDAFSCHKVRLAQNNHNTKNSHKIQKSPTWIPRNLEVPSNDSLEICRNTREHITLKSPKCYLQLNCRQELRLFVISTLMMKSKSVKTRRTFSAVLLFCFDYIRKVAWTLQ